MSQRKINLIAIAGILACVLLTMAMIKLDSACAWHPSRRNFACDVAAGYVSIMAPNLRDRP